MRRLLRGLRNTSNWLTLAPILIFFLIVSQGWLSTNDVAVITNGLDIAGFVVLAFALVPAWIKCLRSDKHTPEAYLFGGLLLMTGSIAASRVWSWAIILFGKPPWMINHWFQSFCYLMFGLAIFYVLKVPNDYRQAGKQYIMYAALLAVALMASFVLLNTSG